MCSYLGVNFSSVALVNIYVALVYARAYLVDLIASLATNNRVEGCRYNSISFECLDAVFVCR